MEICARSAMHCIHNNTKRHTIRFVFCRLVTRIGSGLVPFHASTLSARLSGKLDLLRFSRTRTRTGEFYRCHLPGYVFARLAPRCCLQRLSLAPSIAHWVKDVVGIGTAGRILRSSHITRQLRQRMLANHNRSLLCDTQSRVHGVAQFIQLALSLSLSLFSFSPPPLLLSTSIHHHYAVLLSPHERDRVCMRPPSLPPSLPHSRDLRRRTWHFGEPTAHDEQKVTAKGASWVAFE